MCIWLLLSFYCKDVHAITYERFGTRYAIVCIDQLQDMKQKHIKYLNKGLFLLASTKSNEEIVYFTRYRFTELMPSDANYNLLYIFFYLLNYLKFI